MKQFALAIMAAASFCLSDASALDLQSIQKNDDFRVHYKDIKSEELKCRADRNRVWDYDPINNQWLCRQVDYDEPLEEYETRT